MPITCEFTYLKPKDLPAAFEMLAHYGNQAAILAGGTDLLVWMKEGKCAPQAVVDLKGIEDLHRLEIRSGALFIGPCVTFTEIIESPVVRNELPLLWECSRTVASLGVRNRATLAGNICSAVPSLDGAPALLDYDAVVSMENAAGRREIPISEWFTCPKRTAIRAGELLAGITIPLPQQKTGACYVKLGRYRGEDLAQVGVGILALEDHEYRVAFCAVGPIPTRARKIESALNGHSLTVAAIAAAQALIPEEIAPIADIRASKEYRMHMARIMLARGLETAVARMAGGGPAYGESVI